MMFNFSVSSDVFNQTGTFRLLVPAKYWLPGRKCGSETISLSKNTHRMSTSSHSPPCTHPKKNFKFFVNLTFGHLKSSLPLRIGSHGLLRNSFSISHLITLNYHPLPMLNIFGTWDLVTSNHAPLLPLKTFLGNSVSVTSDHPIPQNWNFSWRTLQIFCCIPEGYHLVFSQYEYKLLLPHFIADSIDDGLDIFVQQKMKTMALSWLILCQCYLNWNYFQRTERDQKTNIRLNGLQYLTQKESPHYEKFVSELLFLLSNIPQCTQTYLFQNKYCFQLQCH